LVDETDATPGFLASKVEDEGRIDQYMLDLGFVRVFP